MKKLNWHQTISTLITIGGVIFAGFSFYNNLEDRLLSNEQKIASLQQRVDEQRDYEQKILNFQFSEIKSSITDIKQNMSRLENRLRGQHGN